LKDPPLHDNRTNTLKRLWTPAAIVTDKRLLAFWRARLIVWLTNSLAVALVVIAIFAGRKFGLSPAIFVLLGISAGNVAVLEAWRIQSVLRLGRWSGWLGAPRGERPVWFWVRTTFHVLVTSVWAIAAGYMAYSALNWMITRR
jgi:hypothetical protein